MKLYRALSRSGWLRSYTTKILFVCFLGIHVPLLTFTIVRFSQVGTPLSEWADDLVITLVGTLLGTGVTLYALFALLAPIRAAATALDQYRTAGTLPELGGNSACNDEAGRLMDGVQTTILALDQKVRQLDAEATTDVLTGLKNRRSAHTCAAAELERARRENLAVTVMMVDIDHFKTINDRFGHAAGDAVLVGIAQALRSQLRPYDIVARIGGDEFCVVLFGPGDAEATAAAERVRRAASATQPAGPAPGTVTLSVGVVTSHSPVESLDELLRIADHQLYLAKAGGRDRVCSTIIEASGRATTSALA